MTAPSLDLELRQRLQQLEASDARLRTELAAAVEREAALAQIAQRSGTRRFTARNRTVLEALANQAVVAVENARLFNQLQTKTQELEIASRHKSEFLANMSHELRTPLNAIIGYSELLQEECEDLGQDDFLPDLGKIHTAGKHLLQLISGILDLSKVEAGRMTMYLEDFDVATLVNEAESIVRPVVEKNRNAFVIDCPSDIGVMHADLVKVRQVLFNLLSNAAKFTEGGTITLTVRRHAEPATYTFAIRDTGIGITDAQLARLFEAFSQAEAHTSRKYGGTGLGLALSREFCRMMGGDIAVDSVAGAGLDVHRDAAVSVRADGGRVMKPTIERLQTQLAGLQAQLAYAQQERDAALKASAAAQERETATADILRLINESPADLERIMPEIGRAIERLCEADHGVIGFEVKGADGRPTFHNWDAIRGLRVFEQGVSRFVVSAADEIRGFTHVVGRIEDWEAEYPGLVGITRADGLTELALLSVPLTSGKSRIGYMLARRNTARAFDAHHITLLQHLAAQAVVAVENARAFNELQARNREVAQALEQQTATADILDVISRSPSNLQAALDAVVLNATRLLESEGAVVIRFMPDGSVGWVAVANGSEIAPGPRLATPAPTPADAGSEAMAILLGGRTVMRHGGPDSIAADAPNLAAAWRARGVNASIVTPLQTTRGRFGALVVTRASQEPYTDAQIRLLETFASQAVIAIENARSVQRAADAQQGDNGRAEARGSEQRHPAADQPRAGGTRRDAQSDLQCGLALGRT